jgi:hypothetical protein
MNNSNKQNKHKVSKFSKYHSTELAGEQNYGSSLDEKQHIALKHLIEAHFLSKNCIFYRSG